MFYTVRGVVLRCVDIADKDALLTILTCNYGKLTVKAKGLRRKNNPITASCQLFTYSEFTLFEYRGQYSINEAHVLNLFQNIRTDLQKYALASYLAQTAEVLSLEDHPTAELQSLLLNCFYALANLDLDCMMVKAVYELRAACITGYMPELTGCCHCGDTSAEWFHLSEGSLLCGKCIAVSGGLNMVRLSGGSLEAMRYICFCSPKKIFSFQIGKTDLRQLSEAAERFLLTQLDRSFSTLTYYHSLGSLP